jgi:hypothetical protein
MRKYLCNVLISIDQLLNTILRGDPNETISSRMGKRAKKGDWLGNLVCRVLDIFDKGHYEKSIEKDEGRPM